MTANSNIAVEVLQGFFRVHYHPFWCWGIAARSTTSFVLINFLQEFTEIGMAKRLSTAEKQGQAGRTASSCLSAKSADAMNRNYKK